MSRLGLVPKAQELLELLKGQQNLLQQSKRPLIRQAIMLHLSLQLS